MSSAQVQNSERLLRDIGISKFSFLPLMALAIVFAFALPQSGIAPIFAIAAIAVRLVLGVAEQILTARMRHLHYVVGGRSRWWFNPRNGAVEEGERPHGLFRDGPYPNREAAERAPQIARERATAWNAED